MKKSLAAWSFAQLDDFWTRYKALSPWGKDDVEQRFLYNDAKVLEAKYDDIEAAITFIREKHDEPAVLDRISYHLKRMPRIPLEEKSAYEMLELFQLKKFMANYRSMVSSIGTAVCERYGLVFFEQGSPAQILAAELDRGGSDPETFYMIDDYDEGLKEARSVIAAADELIRSERIKAEAETRLAFGISFDGREFILAPKEKAQSMLKHECEGAALRFFVETYDDTRYTVRILPSDAALEAMSERERGLALEREAEKRVLEAMSRMAHSAMPQLQAAVRAVARWDIARAGAALAVGEGMTRPRMDSAGLRLRDARFIPCADECKRMGLSYRSLSVDFDAKAAVLFGSNMGGKTVALKTVLFFQLLAQTGLFVPAASFESRIYDHIEYVGELAGERHTGLSGFGVEVWRLASAWAGGMERDTAASGTSLVAYDELARTTGSHEAEALLSAVVEAYTKKPGGDKALFATHFRGVARIEGAVYCRMKGLDKEAAAQAIKTMGMLSDASLEDRLSSINKFMRYEVIPDDGSGMESDALSIASLLGLGKHITERAEYYMSAAQRQERI